MASHQDAAMMDVEDFSARPTTVGSLRDSLLPTNGLAVPETQSGPVLLNGNRPKAVPGAIPSSPASATKLIEQSLRVPLLPVKDTSENIPPEPEPSAIAEVYPDDILSEDIESEAMLQSPGITVATLPTGLCYDVRMRYHCELDPPKQRLDFHPEDPRRIYYIYKALCKAGLVAGVDDSSSITSKFLQKVNIRYATKEEICLVHDAKHFDFVKSTKGILLLGLILLMWPVLMQSSDQSEDMLVHLERQYDSIYFNKLTFKSALLSAGGAIETCRAVVSQQVRNAIAVIRPPGHHAECNRPMGFCLFDNVSIAAKVCQQDYPKTCRKILIFDWYVELA